MPEYDIAALVDAACKLDAISTTLYCSDLPTMATDISDVVARLERRIGHLVEMAAQDHARCAWFAGCAQPATGTTPHPILGDVPTCQKCNTFATS